MKQISISNILIILSILATLLAYINPQIYVLWMNTSFLNQWIYHVYLLQFFTSNFLHWWLLHLLFNSVFVYYFWNQVEHILWMKKYLFFFILNALFVGIGITYFSSPLVNTIWISGFALALITYYTLHLKSIGNPEYTWGITAIVINILIGLTPGVSFLWHILGAIFGCIFYLSHRYLPIKK